MTAADLIIVRDDSRLMGTHSGVVTSEARHASQLDSGPGAHIADPGPLGLAAFAATTFVLSVFNAGWRARPKAFVVLRSGARLTEAELLDGVRAHLVRYKVPRAAESASAFPKTRTARSTSSKSITRSGLAIRAGSRADRNEVLHRFRLSDKARSEQ